MMRWMFQTSFFWKNQIWRQIAQFDKNIYFLHFIETPLIHASPIRVFVPCSYLSWKRKEIGLFVGGAGWGGAGVACVQTGFLEGEGCCWRLCLTYFSDFTISFLVVIYIAKFKETFINIRYFHVTSRRN